MTTKPSAALTMGDRLSHLSFAEACKMLGRDGRRLLIEGGALEPGDLHVGDREACVKWPNDVRARLVLDSSAPGRLHAECNTCAAPCVHLGGLLSSVLENKSGLGLAAPPPERVVSAHEEEVVARALAEREERGKKERMRVTSANASTPWTDYTVTSAASGKTYRVALRGEERGVSYCECPDFKTNTLGTCKHVMKVLARARSAFSSRVRAKPYRRTRITVHVRYAAVPSLALALPATLDRAARAIIAPLLHGIDDVADLVQRLQQLDAGGHSFFVTPDAEEIIQRRLAARRLERVVREIRRDPDKHPLRSSLLKEPLLPYQLDGIAFAAGAGRAIVADEMGLGKTIQGIGVGELLAREAGIRKVLIVCPASLKSQWRSEIQRFSDRTAEIVVGLAKDRPLAYASDAFFTICNYEQVLKDITHIERARWDLIILDEGQRIKNWEAKTSRVVKSLRSRFALVLSGTPLENRLDDLHSVAAFIDPHALGPHFKFQHRHQRRDEDGGLVGYKNMGELRRRLAPILLRRTRDSVRLELPARTVDIVRIAPAAEQKDLHDAHMRIVASIVRKPYLTEMDLLRLRTALLMCRMSANSTLLVDKVKPGWSTKLERLGELLDDIAATRDRKVVLFSEWTTMLDVIEPLLKKRKLASVRLDGSVPQRKRQQIVADFQTDPHIRMFLTTNAGSTGLNLQAANTVINVDLPWNPAVLEQRIARAHRMGQHNPVHVYVLVTEATIEENLLGTLASKRDLALAALDPSSNVSDVDVRTQAEDLKAKLEVLLGSKPEAPVQARSRDIVAAADESVARAGTTLLRAALDMLGQLTGAPLTGLPTDLDVRVTDDGGKKRLSFALPSRDTLANLLRSAADALASPRTEVRASPPTNDAALN